MPSVCIPECLRISATTAGAATVWAPLRPKGHQDVREAELRVDLLEIEGVQANALLGQSATPWRPQTPDAEGHVSARLPIGAPIREDEYNLGEDCRRSRHLRLVRADTGEHCRRMLLVQAIRGITGCTTYGMNVLASTRIPAFPHASAAPTRRRSRSLSPQRPRSCRRTSRSRREPGEGRASLAPDRTRARRFAVRRRLALAGAARSRQAGARAGRDPGSPA